MFDPPMDNMPGLDQVIAELDATRARLDEVERERDEARKALRISEPESGMWALERALAASQAREARLREALRAAHDATEMAQECTDVEGRSDEDVLDAYEEGTRAVLRATTLALASAPGSTDALREVALQVAGAVWASAAPSREMDANECAAIVSRILGERAKGDGDA